MRTSEVNVYNIMDAKPKKGFSPKGGKQRSFKGKDSMGSRLGAKPGATKHFTPYNNNNNSSGINSQKKNTFGRKEDAGKKSPKFGFSKDAPGKRKMSAAEDRGEHKKKKLSHGNKGGESEKTNWAEYKQKKKELKSFRQQTERKDIYEVIGRAKHIWEALRRKDCSAEKKSKLMEELKHMIQGKVKQLSFAHDSVRVLQWFIRFASDAQRQEVFDALKDDMVTLSKSKYGRHLVKKLLMHGNKPLVSSVMQTFRGQVRPMLRHATASAIIEFAYNDKAVLAQRHMLTEELYGNTFTLCKSSLCPTIEKVVEANPEKLQGILEEMKLILTPMAQKEQVIKHSLVHKVFLDYFLFAPDKTRAEMIESIREAVVYMAHTHDGARVAMHCLWHGTPKDRKVIIKTMKSYMVKFATGEFGHLVLLSIFDCVDDTKLVKQTVLAELLSSLDEVVSNRFGKKVLLYLLSPRDPDHVLPETIRLLQSGDSNAHSKKDTATRRKELLDVVSQPLLEHLRDNAATMVMDKGQSVIVRDLLATASGDRSAAMTAVAQLAGAELVPGGADGQLHVAEHPAGHLVLRWLLEQDAALAQAGRTERFCRILLDTVGTKNLQTWVNVNRGAIVLSSLLKSEDQGVVSDVRSVLSAILPQLRKMSDNKGAGILVEQLSKQ